MSGGMVSSTPERPGVTMQTNETHLTTQTFHRSTGKIDGLTSPSVYPHPCKSGGAVTGDLSEKQFVSYLMSFC